MRVSWSISPQVLLNLFKQLCLSLLVLWHTSYLRIEFHQVLLHSLFRRGRGESGFPFSLFISVINFLLAFHEKRHNRKTHKSCKSLSRVKTSINPWSLRLAFLDEYASIHIIESMFTIPTYANLWCKKTFFFLHELHSLILKTLKVSNRNSKCKSEYFLELH